MVTSMVDISNTGYGSVGELEDIIKMALKKTGCLKELDLCAFLSENDRSISTSTYLRLKDTNQELLVDLIRQNILEREPRRTPYRSQDDSAKSPYYGQSLDDCIKEAMAKMNVLRETALCKYIPSDVGYMHHFTFLKMKSANPIRLRNLIKEHILDCTPEPILPKKRNRRHAQKLSDNLSTADSALKDVYRNREINPEMTSQLNSYRQLSEDRMVFSAKRQVEDFSKLEGPKMDQLLDTMNLLIKTLQQRDFVINHSFAPEKGPKKNKIGASEKCFQIIQAELIEKILKREADQRLWDAYLELYNLTN